MIDKLQRYRFEIKYRISEPKAQQIRYFVQNYLECDSFGSTQPDLSYTVHSLYLDSPSLKTFHDTINGDRNRYKLRVRYYDTSEKKPVFFEIKRRYNKVIGKKRAKIRFDSVENLLNGQMPTPADLVNGSTGQMEALDRFCYLQNQLHARPRVHISYRREAYEMAASNAVRVTFDRQVCSEVQQSGRLAYKMQRPTSVFGNTVILELKFTDRFPLWFEELTQLFHLRQDSAAKYVDGILQIGERKLMNAS